MWGKRQQAFRRHSCLAGRRCRARKRWYAVAVLGLSLARPWCAVADEPSAKHVLILHGSDRIVQASTSIDPAMRSTLLARAKQAVTIDTGLLDIAPELQIANEPPRRERLLAGSRDRRPDLIMPLGSIALDFARSHTDLWPGVPIFFYGVADDALLPREAVANVAGLTVDLDVEATLALALNLQPDARELIWIAGAAAYDRRLEQRLTRALQERSAHLQAFGLSGYTLDELEQRLRDVDPGSIVLYLSLLRDHAGGTYLPQVVARRLVEISPAPVYGVHDADFGDGIVGGSFPDLDAHGRQAGALAAEFLNGERSIAEIGIEVSPSVCSLDARALAHWQLTANRAPPNCRVLFQPLTFWQQYRDQLLLLFAAVVLGLALASLVNLRRKHRRAQVEAQQTRLEQAHTARLALVGEISASIAHEITQPLSSILSNAEVAQLLLDAREPNLPDLREIVADIRLDNLRANRIVNHVHDLLQRRELKLERVKINVVATRVLDLARPEAARRGIAPVSYTHLTLPTILRV